MSVPTSRPRLAAPLLLALALVACAATPPPDPIPPHDAIELQSEVVAEKRRINVYTPPGYDTSEQSYAVLYMPDGGIGEDFPHIANTIHALIEEGAIAPVLVVGIENTERGRDLTPGSTTDPDRRFAPMTDGAADFRRFLRTELIPEIDGRYRTTEARAIVGESLAGLFVVDTFVREPELFERYIAMDPSLWWDDHALVRQAEERLPSTTGAARSLWFAGSDAEDINLHTTALAEVLQAHAPAELRWTYQPRPEEQHRTIFRATKVEAFRWALWPAG